MPKQYGPFIAVDFKPGARVEISPHLDAWMMGARFGSVTSTRDGRVYVRLDKLGGAAYALQPDDVFAIITES